ncbi:DUF3310 domain-containing protein [Streptomyces sp. WZ-12]|uniref:DUF3310 domain-containing protein n=1 Tax=Streptomyces sp. WZ-12 TaxID=3030210 RepID=UPI00238124F7|nr:DUF3310 domain-containing protein [Streptomyces sp. WZ-12]
MKYTVGDHVRAVKTDYAGLEGMIVAVWSTYHLRYEVEFYNAVGGNTICFTEGELELNYPELPEEPEAVEHPSHYTSHPSGIECKEIVGHFPFFIGSAIKYLWRAGLKTADPTQDLEKAMKNVEFELGRLEASK